MHEPKREERKLPTLGITIGDVNGIGPEVIIKSALDARIFNQVNLVVYGHGKVLSHYKTLLDIEKFVFNQTQRPIRFDTTNSM